MIDIALTRVIRRYVLGWAALLWLSCMPYRTTVLAEESLAAVSSEAGVVNVNTAGAQELERLPRIGPARAQAILALRSKLKQFSRVEQLLQVKGIGRATFRKLRPLLALSGPTTLENKR